MSDFIKLYHEALAKIMKDGYKWDKNKDFFRSDDWKLWDSVEALDLSLSSLKFLLKKAKYKRRKEYYDILQQLINLIDEALKLLDPENYAMGRGFMNVTLNQIKLKEALIKLEEAFQIYKQYYYPLSINVEIERVAGRSWLIETPIIYKQLCNAIYGIRKYLNLPYNEPPIPEPDNIKETRVLVKRKKKINLSVSDRLLLDKLVKFTSLEYPTDNSSEYVVSCEVCGMKCMNWEAEEHKYSHISLLKAPSHWGEIVFEEGEVKIARAKLPNEWAIVYDLNKRARKEDIRFKGINPKYHIAFIMIKGLRIIGYATWSYLNINDQPLKLYLKKVLPEQRKPFINQIYIVPDERRKGYGSKLLQETFKVMCEGFNKKLIVESPNEASYYLLKKLGYTKEENTIFISFG